MAWDALQGRFQKQRTEEDKGLAQEARSVGGSGGMSGYAPQANPTGGFGGNAGSTTSGGPVSAGFVNYADLYSANEGKAKQMAADVYKGAESKAQGAKDSLQAARNQFAGKAQAGAGSYAPIGGKHGTEFATTAPQPFKPTDKGTPAANAREGRELENDVQQRQSFDNRKAVGQSAVDAGRYGGLFGDVAYGQPLDMDSSAKDNAANYNHFANELDIKSGAGQDYTGPDSLKDSMGVDAYGKLVKQYADAQNAVGGLQSAGGIAEALGYAGDQTGNAALDTGLTQTAGQSNFKRLADRYSSLGKEVAAAQDDSIRAAQGAEIQSDAAAAAWEQMLKDYEAEKSKPGQKYPDGSIVIGSAGGTLGRAAGSEKGARRDDYAAPPGAGTGSDNADSQYGGSNPTYNKSQGGQTSGGLWPNGITHDPDAKWTDEFATDQERAWQDYWQTVPEATKEWLKTLTPAERQAWADAEWAKLQGGA